MVKSVEITNAAANKMAFASSFVRPHDHYFDRYCLGVTIIRPFTGSLRSCNSKLAN
jgi:hypothetical protein